ncbi:MAG: HlyU family transcriptional regulator [Litoreibacter sp.]|nr:HlyU family transcriptional regulator [Litoreibacter sp.]
MSLFSKLFGGSKDKASEPQSVEHKGFKITPSPMREGQRLRLCALIEKGEGDAVQTHNLVRADVLDSHEAAAEAAIAKAKQVIDEQGDRLFI